MFDQQYQRRNTGELLKRIFFSKSILSRLVLINTGLYLLIKIVSLFMLLFAIDSGGEMLSPIGRLLALPSDLSTLASKPWTPFTYMFLQEDFFHILFNVIMLYFGGIIFLEYLSEKKLLSTYIMGGLTGALFFVVSFNLFPVFEVVKGSAVALGASASVLAIIIAIATYVPDYQITLFLFGRLKLKYLAIIFIAIDLLSIENGNAGGHIAHLGGAFWGFIYAYYLKKGSDFYKIFDGFKMPDFGWKQKQTKFETSRPKSGRPMTDETYSKKKVASQQEIDRILDKISRSGYDSLTSQEKELLFKSSGKK